MARAVFREAFKGGHGKPACATIDVTPTWWDRRKRKRTCYVPVASVVSKFPFATDFTIGLRGVSIESLLVKDPPTLFGEEVEKVSAVLEEMGSEWAEPPDEADRAALKRVVREIEGAMARHIADGTRG